MKKKYYEIFFKIIYQEDVLMSSRQGDFTGGDPYDDYDDSGWTFPY